MPRLAALSTVLVAAAVILLVWLPVLAYDFVPAIPVADQTVESARYAPSDGVLEEMRDFYLLPTRNRGREMEVAVAEGILKGQLDLPGFAPSPIGLPFSPDDLEGLPSDLQLRFAGYTVPDFLLAAYVDTGRDEFFAMARAAILAWDEYERSTWLPKGYLWNDHAVAARVRVLAEFWRLDRHRPDYRAEDGRVVLRQAARYRERLSHPGHFTFATNHGLMQNLGLLQIEIAFPTLPDGARYRQLALDRLGQQLLFLIDDQGVIRENSAGYQAFGLAVLGMTFRSMTLLGVPIPADWTEKYERGITFLARLERPDGTLPASGDTDGGSVGWPQVTEVGQLGASGVLHPAASRRPDQELSVYPAAGYWVEWDGLSAWPDPAALSQTVVTWTRSPAPSHKHADELGVLLWSKGVSWLTSVGYWPYGDPGRSYAESWSAANAPHRTNEAPDSPRTASLLSYGSTAHLSALDLERRGPGTYVARRQVVHLDSDLWVIVDHVQADRTANNETVWTMDPTLNALRDQTGDSYLLETLDDAAAARLAVIGSAGTVVREFRGSLSPLAGWHVVQSVPQPATAISVEQPAGDAWTVVVLSTADPDSPRFYSGGKLQMSADSAADGWTVTLPIASGQLTVTRAAERIAVEQRGGLEDATSTLDLLPAPDALPELSSIRAEFERMAAVYPVFQERNSARTKVTMGLAFLLLAQGVVFLLVRRWWARLLVPLILLSLLCWIGLGAVIHGHVLRTWEVLVLS